MYSTLPGASFQNLTDLGTVAWVVPCDGEVNVTWSFGGVEIPIHPLDISIPVRTLTSNTTDTRCIGLWQPIGVDSGNIPDTLDMILGMAFCSSFPAFFPEFRLTCMTTSTQCILAHQSRRLHRREIRFSG
jgi:hypothetical protein